MVTVGVRIEPTERDRLEALAQARGLSLCAYLRDLVRHELGENQTSDSPVRACG
jgi:predicted DNA-binding protein